MLTKTLSSSNSILLAVASIILLFAWCAIIQFTSSIIDYTDRATCIIFGDGAGAVLLEPTTEDVGVKDFILKADGAKDTLMLPTSILKSKRNPKKNVNKFFMQKILWLQI